MENIKAAFEFCLCHNSSLLILISPIIRVTLLKMAEQGTPKACSSTKAANKLAETIKVNFIRTLETNQKFTATRQGLIKKQSKTKQTAESW